MVRMTAAAIPILAILAVAAACSDGDDFLLEETPQATGTAVLGRTPDGSPAATPTATPLAQSTPGPCGETYVVEAGDYPFKIAEKCGVAEEDAGEWVNELLQLNGVDDPTRLQVGQELELPR